MEVTPTSLGAEDIPTDESNLVMRAMAIFAERTGEYFGTVISHVGHGAAVLKCAAVLSQITSVHM